MPACEASDPIAAGRLSEGVPATPAIARRDGGGLVAFVTAPNRDGRTAIQLLPLNDRGQPVNAQGGLVPAAPLPDAGELPSVPALAATRDGYVIAWRQGEAGQHRIARRALSPDGTPSGDITALPPTGTFGTPSLLVTPRGVWTAVAARDVLHVIPPDGEPRALRAPDGMTFDLDPPRLVDTPAGVRAYASASSPAGERALLRLLDGDAPSIIARDVTRPSVLPSGDGVFLAWPARVARHDVGARVARLPYEGAPSAPPLTVATYRGAFDAAVTLAPITDAHLAAVTVSTLADDAGATLNLSLLTPDGRYVGRAPILTSFLARDGRAAIAGSGSGAARELWVAVDGRDVDDGAPQLVLTRARCDVSHNTNPLDVPPGTFVQELLAPETPPARAGDASAPPLRCDVRGHGVFTPHDSGSADALAGTSSAAVIDASGLALLAVTRSAQGGTRGRLLLSRVTAAGRASPPREVLDDAVAVLTAARTPAGAVVVATKSLRNALRPVVITLRGTVTATALVASGLVDPTSAAVASDGSVFVTGRTEAGEHVLARVAVAGRSTTPTVLAHLRDGDAIADVRREGATTTLLLARPDALDGVAQSIALLAVTDGAAPTPWRDPFADPLGHPRGPVGFARGENGPAVLHTDRATLRLSPLTDGRLRPPRSVLGFNPNGGRLLATATGRLRWLALTTGLAPDGATAHAITVVGLDGPTARGVTATLPDDASAVGDRVSLAADGDRVAVLYPHNTPDHHLEWSWVDARCTAEGAR